MRVGFALLGGKLLRLYRTMIIVGLRAQYVLFALGTWIGAVLGILGGHIWERKVIDTNRTELGPGLLIIAYVFVAGLLALPYLGWIWMRNHFTVKQCSILWIVPLLLGIIHLPCIVVLIPLLIEMMGQGQGARIGTAIMVVTFGLPVIFAELSFRISKRS